MSSQFLQAAIAYAAKGWRVFPCNGKLRAIPKSRGGNGCKDATTDLATIERWGEEYRGANIGLATGDGLLVVDLDEKNGISGRRNFARLIEENGGLDKTVVQITPTGGRHILLWTEHGLVIPNSASRLGPNIDVRGQGGYILAAPSIHPETKTEYRWHEDRQPDRVPLAPAPEWLIRLLTQTPEYSPPPRPILNSVNCLTAYGAAALEGALNDILDAGPGTQRDTLNRKAFHIGGLVAASHVPEGLALSQLELAAGALPSLNARRPWRRGETLIIARTAFFDGLRRGGRHVA
jgi:hypothetical protein